MKKFCSFCAHPKHPNRPCMIANCICGKPKIAFKLGDVFSLNGPFMGIPSDQIAEVHVFEIPDRCECND